MTGRCDDRPELADAADPAGDPRPGRCRAAVGADLARRLFEPLGWTVDGHADPARRRRSRSGATSRYVDLRLTGERAARRRAEPPLRAAAGARRRQALLGRRRRGRQAAPGRAAAGWPTHPEQELITRRYLRAPRAGCADAALARLADADDTEAEDARRRGRPTTSEPASEPDRAGAAGRAAPRRRASRCCAAPGARPGRRPRLRRGRAAARRCCADPAFTEVVGVDVSRAGAGDRRAPAAAGPDAGPAARAARRCCQSSLTYRDDRLAGLRRGRADGGRSSTSTRRGCRRWSAACSAHARPRTVVVTTPERRVQRALRRPAGRARCGTATTASSGPGPSSPPGPTRVAAAHGYAVAVPAGRRPTTPRSARRPRWRSSPGDGGSADA